MSDWLTPEEAATELKVSTKTIIRRCASGAFSNVLNVGTEKRRIFRVNRHCLQEAAYEPNKAKEREVDLPDEFGFALLDELAG